MVFTTDRTCSDPALTIAPRQRFLARLAVDGALLVLGAAVLWELASRSLLLVALAVLACLVGGATAVARFEIAPRQAVSAATATSALAASMLLSTSTVWSPDPTVASVLLLVAATGIAVSASQPHSSSRWIQSLPLVATTLLVGPVWALWGGDHGISLPTAARLLAVAVAASGVSWSLRPRWSIAMHVGIAVAAVAGLSWFDLRSVELLAVSVVGLLMVVRWWRVSVDPPAPNSSGGVHGTCGRASVTAASAVMVAVGWLCAVGGAWQAAAVVSVGTVALTVAGAGGGRETTWDMARRGRSLERVAIAIARRSQIDTLTRLPNREAFDRRLAEEIERAVRYQQPVALCFVDIDHFKAVNDGYGHAVGDRVLVEVAESLRSSSRTIDVVCRYGGEEFVVIAPGTWSSDAVVLADRLRQRVSTLRPTGLRWPLTVSVGVAGLPEHAADGKSLVMSADKALYDAKRAGRDLTVVARPLDLTGRA